MLQVLPGHGEPLFDVAATRQLEQQLACNTPSGSLMQRAGLAVARLALAVAPHARQIWIACGPGNNGGDGLEAACILHGWGKRPWVTWLGQPKNCSPDSAAALLRLQQSGLRCQDTAPQNPDLCIDALLGIGMVRREPVGLLADSIRRINDCSATVLAVDLPSGLDADTGQCSSLQVRAHHTLSLLTLKPGLFTASGRDSVGTVWLDTLGAQAHQLPLAAAAARLSESPRSQPRLHASHKGCYGDLAVVGGANGMAGAALLAASAALYSGCGRVFVAPLDIPAHSVSMVEPELMFRPLDALNLNRMVTVFGCGGGHLPAALMTRILLTQAPVVIDADAINSIAFDPSMQALLMARGRQLQPTVLTPHPLEAARLLGSSTQQVQADRLAAAKALSERYACTVALKGSGTVVCAPGQLPVINFSGNAKLATAGTGDVLAGMIGAAMAQGEPAFNATCDSVFQHGELADRWPTGRALTASGLARSIASRCSRT